MTIPLVHVDPETENKRTIGVIMVSVSTDSINLNLNIWRAIRLSWN